MSDQQKCKPYRYKETEELLRNALSDLEALAGNRMPPHSHDDFGNPITWQDIAGTAAINLRNLAAQLEAARQGNVVDGPVVFPSPKEILDEDDDPVDDGSGS